MSKAKRQASKPFFDVHRQFERALSLHQQGRIEDARDIYNSILQRAPNHLGALNLLGALACQNGAHEQAANLISKAISIDSRSPAAHSNLAVTLRELKRFQEALESCDKAIELKSDYAEAYYNRGLILKELGRVEESLASYDKAISIRPDAETYYGRGNAMKELGRVQDALESFDRAIALRPGFAEAHFNRGNALKELNRREEALKSYDSALSLNSALIEVYFNRAVVLSELNRCEDSLAAFSKLIAAQPHHPEYYSGQAVVLQKLGQLDRALESCDKAVSLKPDFAEAFFNRGNVLKELYRLEEACKSFERAGILQPSFVDPLNNMGLCLLELGDVEKAQDAFRKALAVEPNNTSARNNLGLCLLEHGEFERAQSAFREAIDIDPRNVSAYFNLSDCKKFGPDDPDIIVMQKLLAELEGLSKTDRIKLGFALGKAYADLKEYAPSFDYLMSANAAQRAITSYDEHAACLAFDLIESTFSRQLIDAKSGGGNQSKQPVFIVGMPRSGTTLLEQILASHPLVHGEGESEALRKTAQAMFRPDGTAIPYPNFVPALDATAFIDFGSRYLAAVDEGASESERVTDKMPLNFMFLGLIHLALPNAKIIHTVRNPVDTCISCFSKLFRHGQSFTYDLGELGRYYRRYERLMAHWHDVLPPGRILEVQYEDVVADVETQARRILAHCELPWDDRCLSFHKTDRPVRTASLMQVRQPIYKNAVGRWRAYADFIDPLLTALGKDITQKSP